MSEDLTLKAEEGLLNVRVGAIIMKDGRFLIAGNDFNDYLYSVGGRVKYGETALKAVIREVYEETGVNMEVDRLGFIHEAFFYNLGPGSHHEPIYEISFYFYMKVPEDFNPRMTHITDSGVKEHLEWIYPDDKRKYYPEFFRSELKHPVKHIKHIVTDER